MEREQLKSTIKNGVLEAVSKIAVSLEAELKSSVLMSIPNENVSDIKAAITAVIPKVREDIGERITLAILKTFVAEFKTAKEKIAKVEKKVVKRRKRRK